VTVSPRSRWVWLVWPDAGSVTTPVAFMLFMSFLHHSVSGVRGGVDWHVTVVSLGVTMRTRVVGRPGSAGRGRRCRGARTRRRVRGPALARRSSSCTRNRAGQRRQDQHQGMAGSSSLP
jgi:hypothetical protein